MLHRARLIDDGWVSVRGHRLHYLAAGAAPPLVLLHGGIVDSAILSWGGIIDTLAGSHRVVALDLLGYVSSDAPDRPYATTMHVDLLQGVLDALDLHPVRLSWLSLGGAVALGFALQVPDHVDRLVHVSSLGLAPAPPHRLRTYLISRLPQLNRLAMMIAARHRRLVRASLSGIVHDPKALPDTVVGALHRLIR